MPPLAGTVQRPPGRNPTEDRVVGPPRAAEVVVHRADRLGEPGLGEYLRRAGGCRRRRGADREGHPAPVGERERPLRRSRCPGQHHVVRVERAHVEAFDPSPLARRTRECARRGRAPGPATRARRAGGPRERDRHPRRGRRSRPSKREERAHRAPRRSRGSTTPRPPPSTGARVLPAPRGKGGSRRRAPVPGERLLDDEPRLPRVAQASLRVAREAAQEKAENTRRSSPRAAPPLGLGLEHGRERVADGLAFEEATAVEHLEQHDTERPDVGTLVDGLATRLLGRHVGSRAEDEASRSSRCGRGWATERGLPPEPEAGSSRVRLGEAEVQDLDLAVRRHLDVGGLEVAVDDALLVGFLQGLRDLPRDRQRLLDRKSVRASGARAGLRPPRAPWRGSGRPGRRAGSRSSIRRRTRCWVVEGGEQARLALETGRRSASSASATGSTLIAASRPSFVSVARYTSPMPPAPIAAVTPVVRASGRSLTRLLSLRGVRGPVQGDHQGAGLLLLELLRHREALPSGPEVPGRRHVVGGLGHDAVEDLARR